MDLSRNSNWRLPSVVRGGLKPTSSTEASIEIDNDSLKKVFFRYQVSPEFISFIGSLYSHDGIFSTSSFSRQPNGELSDAEGWVLSVVGDHGDINHQTTNMLDARCSVTLLLPLYTLHTTEHVPSGWPSLELCASDRLYAPQKGFLNGVHFICQVSSLVHPKNPFNSNRDRKISVV